MDDSPCRNRVLTASFLRKGLLGTKKTPGLSGYCGLNYGRSDIVVDFDETKLVTRASTCRHFSSLSP